MAGALPVGQKTILTAKDLAAVDDFQKRVEETLQSTLVMLLHITTHL